MRRKLLWLAPWIVLGLSACATVPRPETAKACAEWRWIGIRSPQESACAAIPGWRESPLFPLPSTRLTKVDHAEVDHAEAPAPEALKELERFCVYETDRRPGQVPFPPTATAGLVRIDQDCAAVSRAGSTATAPSWQALSEHFLAQAGRPAIPLVIRNRLGVRLAFLDTHPTGEGAPAAAPRGKGTSEHGYTLAHIARHLVCSPDATCAAHIATRLALPVARFDPRSRRRTVIDLENGGHLGLQSHLAEAILSEVNTWRRMLAENPGEQQHLVLNLSVAWDPALFGGLDEEQITEMRTGTQAVYRALQYAAGYDVLVLAAAGNRRGCAGGTEGPLLPAAWETLGPEGGGCSQERKRPLVYAVGGVDSEGRPLANARVGGMPRRAAYGENGVVPALPAGESTHLYTGSSVATVVASSIAALAWDTVPGLDSGELMSLLDGSGETLSMPASFWSGPGSPTGAAPPVRRLSLCASLAAACAHPGALNCPLQAPCQSWAPRKAPFAALAASSRSNTCHPWTTPQPDDFPCPICNPPRN